MIPKGEYSETLHKASMRPMPRTLPSIQAKYPMHTVTSQSRTIEQEDSGLTFSMENRSDTPAAQAEYEVLKAILTREGYLKRLQEVVRTVGKRFKPEIADILDFVRTSSLEVIQAISKWREVKNDLDATFVWNGLNYLLKMPSDLDYLADYVAVQKWMGFPLVRNPFCIPYPMESASQHFDELTDPKNIADSNMGTIGYQIGGRQTLTAGNKKISNSSTTKDPNYISPYDPKQKLNSKSQQLKDKSKIEKRDLSSYIFNEDMKKIRHAESVILAAEAKFGVFSRDPQGRLVPILQALTRKAAMELKKDDRRPLSEPAEASLLYAPHAANSDVGIVQPAWTPEVKSSLEETLLAEKTKNKFVDDDTDVNPRLRGEGKGGGALAPFETKASDTRGRKPIKASISSSMDFRRQRNIKSLTERIQEIQQLREEIEQAKQTLNSDNELSHNQAKLQVIRSALSNQTSLTQAIAEANAIKIPQNVEKYEYDKSPDKDQLLSKFMRSASNKISVSKSDKGLTTISAPANMEKPLSSTSSPKVGRLRKEPSGKGEFEKKRSLSVSFLEAEKDAASTSNNDDNNSQQRSLLSKDSREDPSRALFEEEDEEIHKDPEAVIQAREELEKELQKLQINEASSNRRLDYYLNDQRTVDQLKTTERVTRSKERSRNIERKRRLLTEEEGKRLGPPPEEERNVYDFYAIRAQSLIRGWLARCWVKWYKMNATKACIVLQSAMRGWFGRMRVRKIRREAHAATIIQKNFRGWSERGTSVTVAKQRNLVRKAIVLQRVWRGVLGKRRANSKRALDKAAKDAFDAVDAKSLVAADVKELATRLIYAIEEPTTTTFPPDEVLHLLRLSLMVINSCRGNIGLTGYDFFNVRNYDEYTGEDLTWELAAKMVNRSERFIRLIRAVAYGPGAKPPRLLQLSSEGNLLYAAQGKNPLWKLQTFETMGLGSKICCQLFKWLTSVVDIAIRQQEFLSLIATSFPDWLPKLNGLQASARFAEFEYELNKKCYSLLTSHAEQRPDDPQYLELLEIEMKYIKKFMNDARHRSKELIHEINKLKNDQSSREVVALDAMEQRVIDADENLKELAAQFKDASELAQRGDRRAQESLSELRHSLTNQKLKLNELAAQKKLLEIQVESNRAKRKDPAQLPPEIYGRTILAGEAKAAHIIATVDTKAMLVSAGVKDPTDLPIHLVDIYDSLSRKEATLRTEARTRFVEADNERSLNDEVLTRQLQMQDLKEQKAKDQMLPTDVELEEERLEDEKEAVAERIKHLQYLPDSVVFDIPQRPRPVIIAFARDLPGYLKRRIHQEINRLMPGLFVYLNNTTNKQNMGMDLQEMQAVLDSKRSILMNIDHGLTRVTRNAFLNTLELTVEALYPKPLIILAVGDEKNMKNDLDAQECGVIAEDMQLLRDDKIKSCLEWMAWCSIQLLRPHIRKHAQILATELVPHTKALGIVLEAYFILFSNDAGPNHSASTNEQYNFYRIPNTMMPTMIWQRTKQILIDLNLLYQSMYQLKRGTLPPAALTCMNEYLKHSFWPKVSDECRKNDLLLHALATFIEKLVECESLTLQGGGIPLQSLTKSSLRGIQAVVTIKDAPEQMPKNLVIPLDASYERFHWKPSSFLLIRAALQDLRILKTVITINKQAYTVAVYREKDIIYFEIYHPQTSEVAMTTITTDKVPALIIPNGHERKVQNYDLLEPPKTSQAMYEKLISLLKLKVFKDTQGKIISRQLICQRDYILLDQMVRKINGYTCVLKCYEGAYGELYFTIYIPEYSFQLTHTFSMNERMILLKTADDQMTEEQTVVQVNEARPLLPFVIDRLQITPSRTMYLATNAGGSIFEHVRLDHHLAFQQSAAAATTAATSMFASEVTVRKQQDINGKQRIIVSNVKPIGQNPNIQNLSSEAMKLNANKQFLGNIHPPFPLVLKTKVHGKAGKVIYRRVIRFNEILFQLVMKLSTPKGIVIVYLYEPMTRKTLELRIPPFLRKILLDQSLEDCYQPSSLKDTGSALGSPRPNIGPGRISKAASTPTNSKDADYKRYVNITPSSSWIQGLLQRLKVQWNVKIGFHLYLNQVLLKTVIPIQSHPLPNVLSPAPMAPSTVPKRLIRLLFQLSAKNEQTIFLEIAELSSSQVFGLELTRDMVLTFFFHKTNVELLQSGGEPGKKKSNRPPVDPKTISTLTDAHILSVIDHMESELNDPSREVQHTANITSQENGSIYDNLNRPPGSSIEDDPVEIEKQRHFESILLDSSLLQYLLYKIAHHLVPINPAVLAEGLKTIYFPLSLEFPLIHTQRMKEYENMKNIIQQKKVSLNPLYQYDLQLQKQLQDTNTTAHSLLPSPLPPDLSTLADDYINKLRPPLVSIDTEITLPPVKADTEKTLLHQNYQRCSYNNPKTLNLSTGDLASVLRTRYQAPILNIEYELNLLAIQRQLEAMEKKQEFDRLSTDLSNYVQTFNNNVLILNQEIFDTTYTVAKNMLTEIATVMEAREEERQNPGQAQEKLLAIMAEEQEQKQAEQVKYQQYLQQFANEEERLAYERSQKSEEEAIVNNDWKLVFALGCKVNFREGKVTWHGHVSIRIEEDQCWISDFGMGKRYKFIVYEPNCSMQFEGIIRSTKHLKEVLGIHGKDLLIPNREKEMLIFVCRYRLEVVVNKKTWDGADVEEGAPPYRIEFQTDRLYTQDKITPINAAEEKDEVANEDKLIEIENARGRKIMRLVRRISGLLMQLTVFELPPAIAEAALLSRPVKGLVIERNNSGGIDSINAILPEEEEVVEKPLDGKEEVLPLSDMHNDNENPTAATSELPEPQRPESPTTKPLNAEEGLIENRKELKYLKRFLPPALRIVGYDPKSKRKVILPVEPQAVIEVCGGIFSPYLDPDRRRELARIVSEALILYFPNMVNNNNNTGGNQPKGGFYANFELMLPWSGNTQNAQLNTIDMKTVDSKKQQKKKQRSGHGEDEDEDDQPLIAPDLQTKNSRSAANRINNRKGRIFRSVLRISKYELIVSIYQFSVNHSITTTEGTSANTVNHSIIVNFYSPAVTEAKEITLSEADQIERIDQPIVTFQEGAIRTAAIRRLMRYFKAEIIEDILDPSIRELHVVLLPPGKDFITEYKNISKAIPNENTRPVGLTNLFFPLDTCGIALHRSGITLWDRNNHQHSRDFLVTIYTKSIQEFVERGLIIKLYDRLTCNMSILHLSPSELIRILHYYDEDSLLPEIVQSKIHEESYQIDEIEEGLKEFTEKGKLEKKTNELVKILIQIILKDLGFYMSPLDSVIPYMKSSPKGIFPE